MKILVIITELSPSVHKAHCPVLPGCVVLGRSRQEALDRMSNAIAGYLASFDATVPERLDLEVLEYGRELRRTARDGTQVALVSKPGGPDRGGGSAGKGAAEWELQP
jgi:predicted RNase H-like HicB family nuclease